MKKLYNSFLYVLMLMALSICTVSAKAETLTVTPNEDSGIEYANYIATLSDGTILGFYKYYYETTVYFCGAITSSESITVPDSILFSSSQYAVSCIGSPSGYNIDFDEAVNLTELYLPATTTDIYDNIPGTIVDLHIAATDVPSLSSSSCISDATTVWVPQSAYGSYQDAVTNSNSRWYGKDVHYEGWEPNRVTVNVRTAGSLGYEILKVADQWTDVDELTVTGSLNEDDMKILSHMTQLRNLDLSQTDITTIGYCSGLSKLSEIVLPSTVTVVEASAFSGCYKLRSFDYPNITEVGEYAFSSCISLTSIAFPMVQTIGSYAFSSCRSLTSIDFPMAQTIGREAFYYCSSLTSIEFPVAQTIGREAFYYCGSLTSIDFPMAQTIGSYAFYYCGSLTSIEFPMAQTIEDYAFCRCSSLTSVDFPMAQTIGDKAFYRCSSLTSIDFPMAQNIGSYAFDDCSSLADISIPSCIMSIGSSAFSGCYHIKDVYCYAVVPPYTSAFWSAGENAILHVPEFSVTAYKLDDNWYNFTRIEAIDGETTDIYIAQDFTIYEYTGLADDVNLTLTTNSYNKTSGHLTVDAVSEFSLDTFTQDQDIRGSSSSHWDGNNYVYTTTYPYCTTLIAKNEIGAENIVMNLTVYTKRWNFISFPFDVNVSDIKMPEGTLWVVRKYSGADRAAMTGNTWQNMTNDMVLNAGEGYILQCTDENSDGYYSNSSLTMQVTAVNNENKNNIFAYDDVTTALNEYPSEYAHNCSWNLIGNPYPAYFDIKSLDFTAPITVWTGDGYIAYSILDDEYTLRPNEAFFVQCPTTSNTITFQKEGRSHGSSSSANNNYYDYKPMRPAYANANKRSVLNFTISGNAYTDRTRLVLNESAKPEYEIECDASKFMSSNADVPQIYVMDGDLRYAIDERPVGNGEFVLGSVIGKDGEYTIKLDAQSFEGSITLTDTETGLATDILNNEYSFVANAGTYDGRFVITINNGGTGIHEISDADGNSDNAIYNLTGQKVNGNAKGIVIENGKKVIK